MDKVLNKIPDEVRTIHLIAACGTGMAALACILSELGYQVTGSDHNVYPPMSLLLTDYGIPVSEGFSGDHLAYRPDLVVVGNAVTRNNPEVVKTRELGLNYCSMPQAINHFVADGKEILLITGTHGKTTTSSLLAWMLQTAGYDPSFIIGGVLNNFNSSFRLGEGRYIVLEGDEYDTAFFDKRSKFFHYPPAVAILTGIEFDHADIFADLKAVTASFEEFLSRLSPACQLFAWDTSESVSALIQNRMNNRGFQVIRYGQKGGSAWRLGRVTIQPPETVFEVIKHDTIWGTFTTRLTGRHNLLNTLGAIGVAEHLGLLPENIQHALDGFTGVKRRQEVSGVRNGVTVMDDFAHHPTAVAETITGLKPFYTEGRLIAVFEPRTNTSMRNIFQNDYVTAFDGADLICISQPPFLEKVPEDIRFSSRQLVDDLNQRSKNARCFSKADAIVEFLKKEAVPGDLILVMSNGGFDNIHQKLLQQLQNVADAKRKA